MRFTAERNALVTVFGDMVRSETGIDETTQGHILLCLAGNEMTLFGYGSDTAIRRQITISGKGDGKIAVPSKLFTGILSALPNEPVDVAEKQGNLLIRCGKSRWTLNCIPASSFAPFTEITGGVATSIVTGQLATIINAVGFISATGTGTSPVFSSVYLRIGDGSAMAVATDGHRLATLSLSCPEGIVVEAVIDIKAATDLKQRLLKEPDVEAVIRTDGHWLCVTWPGWEFRSRLIEQKYPNWRAIVGINNPKIVWSIDTEELYAATKRAGLVAQQGSTHRVTMKSVANGISIQSTGFGVGSVIEEIPAVIECDDDSELGVNFKYMLQSLHSIRSGSAQLATEGGRKPIIITTPDEPGLLHMVMPMMSLNGDGIAGTV